MSGYRRPPLPPLRNCGVPGCPRTLRSWRESPECDQHRRQRTGARPDAYTGSLRDYLRERKAAAISVGAPTFTDEGKGVTPQASAADVSRRLEPSSAPLSNPTICKEDRP